jgi:hypothetical protein
MRKLEINLLKVKCFDVVDLSRLLLWTVANDSRGGPTEGGGGGAGGTGGG